MILLLQELCFICKILILIVASVDRSLELSDLCLELPLLFFEFVDSFDICRALLLQNVNIEYEHVFCNRPSLGDISHVLDSKEDFLKCVFSLIESAEYKMFN